MYRQRGLAALEQPITPLVVERLGDLVLATDITDTAITTQAGKDDLEFLLGGERPVLPLILLLEDLSDHHPHAFSPGQPSTHQRGPRQRRPVAATGAQVSLAKHLLGNAFAL